MKTVTSRDGDTIDAIAFAEYGRTAEATEALIEANPHLAGLPAQLPAGRVIVLPDLPSPKPSGRVRLWD